jgi:hypothetical protein
MSHENEQDDVVDRFVVANEFAAVSVAKVRTRNGERLEIRSLGHDHSIRLDALALEALTWSDALEVGKGLETPLGPDPAETGTCTIAPTGAHDDEEST